MTWESIQLGEFVTLKRGYDLPSSLRVHGRVPVVSSSGVTGRHDTARVKGPGVVTGRYGTLGEVYFIADDFWPLNTSLYVQDFKGNDPRFSAYFLESVLTNTKSDKAAVPGINRNDLHARAVRVTRDVGEQRAIAAILGAYDDLLENNRRRIRLLEQAARLLYEEWFVRLRFPGHEHVRIVDGVPENWEVKTLGDIARTNEENYRAEGLPEQINYIDISSVTKGRITGKTTMPSIVAPGRARRKARSGDVIWSNVRPNLRAFALVLDPDENDVVSTGFTVLTPVDVPYSYMYLLVTTECFINYLDNHATGASYPAVRSEDFERARVVCPDMRVLELFHESVGPMFRFISILESEARRLEEARDLLPAAADECGDRGMTRAVDPDLAGVIARGEGATVEFKRSLGKDVGRELCAFANAGGGTVLVGVSDTGEIAGVANHNRLKSRVLSTARSADPPIDVAVESSGAVLRVVVPAQKRKPYSFGGRFFVRDGASSRQMSNAEVEDLFYAAGRLHFDRKPCPDFSIENDLDDEPWVRFSRRAKIPEAMDRMLALRNLGLVDSDDRMTHAGAWLLAGDVRRFTTSAHVSCALFLGTEKVRILDRRDFHGDVPAMVDDAVAWILTKINVEFIIRHVRRQERPELPEEALREAVANAVAHRDYRSTANVQIYVFKDRIEIVSPGGLPAGMTEADLGTKSMPRNPLLFGMLYRMDVVEHIGSGIKRIRDLCREHDVAEPIIDVSEHWVTVTFPRPTLPVGERDIRQAGSETGGRPKSQPEPGQESAEVGLESAAAGLGLERAGPESGGAGQESLERRVLALLLTGPLSKSALAAGLGHQSVSAGLNRVVRCLLQDGLVAHTVPDKPNSRLQRYRITLAGQATLQGSAE